MLGRLRMSVRDCISEYLAFGKHIFSRPRWLCIRGPLFFPFRDKYPARRIKNAVNSVVTNWEPRSEGVNGLAESTFAIPPGLCQR